MLSTFKKKPNDIDIILVNLKVVAGHCYGFVVVRTRDIDIDPLIFVYAHKFAVCTQCLTKWLENVLEQWKRRRSSTLKITC